MTDAQSQVSALKPCPFCGEGNHFYPMDRRIPYRIKCGGCDGEGGAGSTIEIAINLWNTRIQPPEVSEDELVEIVYASTWVGGNISNKEEARDMVKALRANFSISRRVGGA